MFVALSLVVDVFARRRSLHLMILIIVMSNFASVARAQKAPPPPQPASEFFAEKVGGVLGRPVDLSASKNGVPQVFIDLINKRYNGDSYAQARQKQFQELQVTSAAFAKQWNLYEARKKAVSGAIARAKSAPDDQVESILRSVITPATRNEKGFITRDRVLIEPYDAEIEAVLELAKVLSKNNDFAALAELTANLMGCRKVSNDRNEELLMWLATKSGRTLGNLRFGQHADIGHALDRIAKAAHSVQTSKRSRRFNLSADYGRLAESFHRALPDYGLKRVQLGDYKGVKRNDWVLMDGIFRPKLSNKSLNYVYNKTFHEPYDCRTTNKIIGWNLVTGQWDYERRCKQRPIRVKASVKAKLITPPPSWTESLDRFDSVWVVGKVQKRGPAWRLTDSVMADFRFLEWRPRRY